LELKEVKGDFILECDVVQCLFWSLYLCAIGCNSW